MGAWMKLELNTPDKPEVRDIADSLGIDRDAVVGKLVKVWRWFDLNTTNGRAEGIDLDFVDEKAGTKGFGASMQKVGWLKSSERYVTLPKFSRHNGKSAKKRALTARRQAEHRKRGSNADRNAQALRTASPEKRREEKNKTPPTPPWGDDAARPDDLGSDAKRHMQVMLVAWAWPDLAASQSVPPSSYAKAGESARSLHADGVTPDELPALLRAYWPDCTRTPSGVHQRVAELRQRVADGSGESEIDRVMRVASEGGGG